MKNKLVIIILFTLFAFSPDKNECDERTMPYWWNGINSRVEGENLTLRKAYREIQLNETNIKPSNGFITLKLYISKTGQFCDIKTFQINENYKSTEFNNGELKKDLEKIAIRLSNWKKEKDFKTYNLIRFKIKNGKIEEIF